MERPKILEILRAEIKEKLILPDSKELGEGECLREDLGAD